jgi:hypothetical protein
MTDADKPDHDEPLRPPDPAPRMGMKMSIFLDVNRNTGNVVAVDHKLIAPEKSLDKDDP